MFVAVHCFYRKAIRNGRNPFHSPNKMAQDIMQVTVSGNVMYYKFDNITKHTARINKFASYMQL